MTHSLKSKGKPKPVKAWAIMNPKGTIIEISLTRDIELYHSVYFSDEFEFLSTSKREAARINKRKTLSEIVLENGYRCIRVEIRPL